MLDRSLKFRFQTIGEKGIGLLLRIKAFLMRFLRFPKRFGFLMSPRIASKKSRR